MSMKDNISGLWILVERLLDETHVHRINVEVDGNKISGQFGIAKTRFKFDGAIENSVMTFKRPFMYGKRAGMTDGQKVEATYRGKMQDGCLVGEGTWGNIKSQWIARRPATRTVEAPQTYTFTPTEFHRVISATIPPALRIFPGDTVQTKSIDSGGYDENSAQRSLGGNPLTGPFYVEGALPGDTLVVRWNRMRPNRDWAESGDLIVGSALTWMSLLRLKRVEGFNSRWRIDNERGLAYLDKPTAALKNFTIPLQPMLGCVCVAPPGRKAASTTDLGVYGGNMDYNRIRDGITLYLPVFHEGALLFMGDGHAVQGDGELTGDALETSMEFEFEVDVIPEKSISAPRAEDADSIMAIGVGNSLDQALQHATTGMASWLEEEYKLNSPETAMVLGCAMKYEVAKFLGDQATIVAKLPKSVIAQLKHL